MVKQTLAAIGGALVLCTGCSADEPPPPSALAAAPSLSPAATPTLTLTPNATPSPTPTPTPSPVPTVKALVKRWSYTAKAPKSGNWFETQVLNVSGNFVNQLGLTVRGYTPKGKEKWQRDFPRDRTDNYLSPLDDVEVQEAAGVLIASYAHPTKGGLPHPNVIEALDPATGRTLWKTVASPYESVLDDTVYTPVCRGKRTERQDDCRLSARDARTGWVRWTIPTEHAPYIRDGDGTTLAMGTHPKGKSWVTALDKRTGARLGLRVEGNRFVSGRPLKEDSSSTYVVDGKVVLVTSTTNYEAENCAFMEAARDVRTGKRVWHAAWTDPDCNHDDWEGNSLPGVTKDGRLTLRDPATGKVTWRSKQPGGRILATDGRNVLVISDDLLTLYGKARTWAVHARRTRSFLTKGQVVLAYSDVTEAYDLRTGKPIGMADGRQSGRGDGWVATTTYDDGKTTITLYRL